MSQATLHRACICRRRNFSGYTAPCMFVINHKDDVFFKYCHKTFLIMKNGSASFRMLHFGLYLKHYNP